MKLGSPWTDGYVFAWRLSLELKEATQTLICWRPSHYQWAGNLEVRVYLDGDSIWKACELLVRDAYFGHPWKLNLAHQAICEWMEVVVPTAATLIDEVTSQLGFMEREQFGTKKAPPLPPLMRGEVTLTSEDYLCWAREYSVWRGLVVAVGGCQPCKACRGPVWETARGCPTCGRRPGGLMQRLRSMSWLLNTPKLDG